MASTLGDQSKPVTGYPAVTGHPYVAPPPASYYTHPIPFYKSRRTGLIRRLILAIIAVFMVLTMISFITALVFRPRVPEIRVDQLSVSNFNFSTSQLTGKWVVDLHIINPNTKMGMFCDGLWIYLIYENIYLYETSLEPLYVEKMSERRVNTTLVTNSGYLGVWEYNEMALELRSGVVSFDVRMLGSVTFEAKSWLTRRISMEVYCGDLMVELSAATGEGELINKSVGCVVYM